jgi:D-glycero-D-manno-heptose 1,7-bisphosphate phosphatase
VRERLADDFLLINGDIVFDIDIPRFLSFHRDGGLPATIAVHPNSHPHDSAVVMTDAGGRVTAWLGKDDRRGHCGNQVNAGLHVLSKRLLAGAAPADGIADLDRDILRPLIAGARTIAACGPRTASPNLKRREEHTGVLAYRTPEYIKDMGTPERYRQVEADVKAGLPRRRNLANRQTAVFLDRDGTISRLDGFVTRPEQLRLDEGAAEAVRAVNGAGFLAIVITNQPVIARGECSVETLEEIHRKMEGDLGAEGACLDDIYYCPHHPDRGFAGERPEYKIDCECRKPKPGMILAAARKYNIDLSRSFMIGDDTRDALAGIAAGCRPALIRRAPDRASRELVGGIEVPVYGSLREAVAGLLPRQ